jgi:hypothetical protein
MLNIPFYIQEHTELQRVGAKMAALCTPQEVTQPGIYFLNFCRRCHKGPIYAVLVYFYLFSFRQPRHVLTIF